MTKLDHGLSRFGHSAANYSELGDGQVMEALSHHLDELRVQECPKEGHGVQEIILFRGAIEHATRLCRVMVSSALL